MKPVCPECGKRDCGGLVTVRRVFNGHLQMYSYHKNDPRVHPIEHPAAIMRRDKEAMTHSGNSN